MSSLSDDNHRLVATIRRLPAMISDTTLNPASLPRANGDNVCPIRGSSEDAGDSGDGPYGSVSGMNGQATDVCGLVCSLEAPDKCGLRW